LLVDRYEFWVYRLLRQGLESGRISCRQSVRFRSFEDDLIPEEEWRQHKDALIASIGLPVLSSPITEQLADLERHLEDLVQTVNRRIATGENTQFKVTRSSPTLISYHDLQEASDDFMRLETLGSANDLVVDGTAALPITQHYNLGGVVHSSSDGQKFETRRPTFNARHGPKYFGLKKGIVADTLVINHIPVSARIIGANEHESHYVFDLLFNNTTSLRPDVHSTDTHGTNEVNFALLHAFKYQFAPRYADISEKVRTSLFGFQHPRQYASLTLWPMHKANTALIIEDWDNVLRIFVSLARKTTSQSIIVSKLSSYARRNRT